MAIRSGRWWVLVASLMTAWSGWADDVRLWNGTLLPGTPGGTSPAGLEVLAGEKSSVYPWYQLSAGTRFRHDPVYRANLAVIQRGLPEAARTHAPEGGYRTAGALPEPPPLSAATGGGQEGPVNLEAVVELPSFARNRIPGLTLKNPTRALGWGMRFGGAAQDVVYLVYDPPAAGAPPDTLYIFQPTATRLDRIRASSRAEAEGQTLVFRKLRYTGLLDGARVMMDVVSQFASARPSTLAVSLEVELARLDRVARFTLVGSPPGVLVGDGAMEAEAVLTAPQLSLGVEGAQGRPILAGNLRMGRLLLLPGRGMSESLHLVITDDEKKVVLDTRVPVKLESGQERRTLQADLGGLQRGRKYALKATLDLGPLLGGEMRYEESFVIPDAL